MGSGMESRSENGLSDGYRAPGETVARAKAWQGARVEAPWVALLAAAYLLPLLLVSPIGEFALIDDWNHALSVRHLVEEERLWITEWTATTLVAQVAWGTIFATLFGFSFSVLRLSTLVLSFGGGLALYALCREIEVSKPRALAGAVIFWLNPLTFGLSYTFMSDVPFAALLILATFFYARGVGRESDLSLVAGSCFAGLAFLVRHPGILIPLAVLVYGDLARWPLRLLARRGLLIAGLPVLTVGGYLVWSQRQGLPGTQGRFLDTLLQEGPSLWQPALVLTGYILVYLGFFCLPLALGLGGSAVRAIAGKRQAGPLAATLVWAATVIGLVALFARRGSAMPEYSSWMPYLKYGSMMHAGGMAPDNLLGERAIFFTPSGRVFVTVLAACGLFLMGAVLYCRLVPALRSPARPAPPVGPIALIGLFQFAGIFPTSAHLLVHTWLGFDRYFLPLVPLAIALGLWAARGLRLSPTMLVLGLLPLALFSLAGTQDWLSYNRLRWDLGRELVASGVPLEQVDAGMEWDGWHLYQSSQARQIEPRTPDGPFWTWAIAPAVDSTYVISFSPLPGYHLLERREYASWLHRQPVYLYLLRRQ